MNKIYGITGLLLFICVFTALKNPAFIEPFNLQNTLKWIALFGILAIGMAFVIMTAGIDLSIGSVVGLTGCLLAMFLTETITRMDSHEVLSTSATANSIHIATDQSRIPPGTQYLYAGQIHTIESVAAGANVTDADGLTSGSAIATVSPAPKEGVASQAVHLRQVQSIDRKSSTFILEGDQRQLASQDQLRLITPGDGAETAVATFVVDHIALAGSTTRVTVEEDLRRVSADKWQAIESSKHAVLFKRKTPMSVPIAIGLVLLISVGIGVFHGLSITKFGMQPFIVTLCGLLFYRGISREITADQTQGFGTGYHGLKYLANGKPFSMAFLILMAGLLQIAWFGFKYLNAKRGGERNLKPYRIGMLIGLTLAIVGSSRYIFAYLPLGGHTIAAQHLVQKDGIEKADSTITITALGDLSSLTKNDTIFFSPSDGGSFTPTNVDTTWVLGTKAEPITHITVDQDPTAGQAITFADNARPVITMGYRVTFVEPEINEITITSDHPDLIRGDQLIVRSGAGTDEILTVKFASPTADRSQTIVQVDAVPANVDLSSVVTVSMRNPRPQAIPGYLLIGLGGCVLLLGLGMLAGPLAAKRWADLRAPIMVFIGGASALLTGLTPIPLILVPMPFVIMLVCALAAGVFVNQTIYGRYILALGRNEQAARYSGINTNQMIILTYVLCSLAAGVGGVLFALEINNIAPSTHGNFYELFAIAGVVMGGCSLRGGEGSILGVVIGVAVMRVLLNAVQILGIDSRLEYAIIGAVIFLGVLVDELVRRWAARRRAAREARLAMTGE